MQKSKNTINLKIKESGQDDVSDRGYFFKCPICKCENNGCEFEIEGHNGYELKCYDC